MPAKQQRVQVTLSPVVRALVEEVHKLTGTPRAALISEMLDDVAPVYQAQLEAHRKLAAAPDMARQIVSQTGWEAVHQIAQAQLDLPPAKKTRRRRNAGAS